MSGLISAALACFPGLSIYLSQNLKFKGPVQVGESLTAVCMIDEDRDGDRHRLTTGIKDDDGERVLDGTATVLVDPLPA